MASCFGRCFSNPCGSSEAASANPAQAASAEDERSAPPPQLPQVRIGEATGNEDASANPAQRLSAEEFLALAERGDVAPATAAAVLGLGDAFCAILNVDTAAEAAATGGNRSETAPARTFATLVNAAEKPRIELRVAADYYVFTCTGSRGTTGRVVEEFGWTVSGASAAAALTQVAMCAPAGSAGTALRNAAMPLLRRCAARFGRFLVRAGRTTVELATMRSEGLGPVDKTAAAELLDLHAHHIVDGPGASRADRGPLVVLDMDGTISRKDSAHKNTADNNLSHSRAVTAIKSCLRGETLRRAPGIVAVNTGNSALLQIRRLLAAFGSSQDDMRLLRRLLLVAQGGTVAYEFLPAADGAARVRVQRVGEWEGWYASLETDRAALRAGRNAGDIAIQPLYVDDELGGNESHYSNQLHVHVPSPPPSRHKAAGATAADKKKDAEDYDARLPAPPPATVHSHSFGESSDRRIVEAGMYQDRGAAAAIEKYLSICSFTGGATAIGPTLMAKALRADPPPVPPVSLVRAHSYAHRVPAGHAAFATRTLRGGTPGRVWMPPAPSRRWPSNGFAHPGEGGDGGQPEWRPTHAIVLLGFEFKESTALKWRINAAAKEWRRLRKEHGSGPAIVVTGGIVLARKPEAPAVAAKRGNPLVTEAAFMRDRLIELGVAPAHIRLEKEARYTIQNALFVRAILNELKDEVGEQLTTVVLITSTYHMMRSKHIFDHVLGSGVGFEWCLDTVESPDPPSETTLAETGKTAEQWAEQEGAQLKPRYGDDVGDASVKGVEPGHRAVLTDRVLAHVRLIDAVKMDNKGALAFFKKTDADVNVAAGRGETYPLHYAVHAGNLAVVNVLLDMGADADATNANGCTALHFVPFATLPASQSKAEQAKNRAAIETALKARMSPAAVHKKGTSGLWREALTADEVKTEETFRATGGGGGDGLQQGSQRRGSRTAFSKQVVIAGTNEVVDYGALHTAAAAGDRVSIAAWLRHYDDRAKVDFPFEGSTALHFAALNGRLGAVTSLLAAGAQVSRKNRFGSTPLHNAVWKQHKNVVGLLLSHDEGNKALGIAGKSGLWEGAKTPLELAQKASLCVERRGDKIIAMLKQAWPNKTV